MPSATTTNALYNADVQFILHGDTATIGGILPAASSNFYIGLFTTLPALAGTGGVEVSGGGYARQPIVRSTAGWTSTGSGTNLEYSNIVELTFPVPSANWGTIVGSGLFSAVSGGTLLFVSSLTTPKTVNLGDGAPKILQGNWRISRAYC